MFLDPRIVDLIVSARAAVRSFKSGEIGLEEVLREAHVPEDFDDLPLVRKVMVVYAVLHRIGAAIVAFKGKKIPDVQQAANEVKGLRPTIEKLLEEIPQPEGASELEQAGFIFLVSELNWGLRIINETLPACGY